MAMAAAFSRVAAPVRGFASAVVQLPDCYVSPQWLKEASAADPTGVKILDASWNLPTAGKTLSNYQAYLQQRIPGARFFDIEAIADPDTDLPHMLPSADQFAQQVGKGLGISHDDTVVVYDTHGLFSAPRAWWTLKAFGAARVSILRGGLPAWIAAGYELETGETQPWEAAEFHAQLRPELVRSMEQIQANVALADQDRPFVQMFDARAAARFTGAAPEIRPGMSSGHIPYSQNIPFSQILEVDPKSQSAVLKSKEALLQAFRDGGLEMDKPAIMTCGSGITACIVSFGLETMGKHDYSVYDGSWTEWATRGGEVWTGED